MSVCYITSYLTLSQAASDPEETLRSPPYSTEYVRQLPPFQR
jgi:hypothetical protein